LESEKAKIREIIPDMSYEFTSRYDTFGPPNGCDGDCEGTGWVPVHENDSHPVLSALWRDAHAKPHEEPCDGWHFVRCPKCSGLAPADASGPFGAAAGPGGRK